MQGLGKPAMVEWVQVSHGRWSEASTVWQPRAWLIKGRPTMEEHSQLPSLALQGPGDPVITEHELGAHREPRRHHSCSSNPQSSLTVKLPRSPPFDE